MPLPVAGPSSWAALAALVRRCPKENLKLNNTRTYFCLRIFACAIPFPVYECWFYTYYR
jgi:hypothetical protein